MSDRYLWDKGGKPDPDLERLEDLLSRYGHRGEPLTLPEEMPVLTVAPRRPIWAPLAWNLAAAAMLMALIVVGTWVLRGTYGWRVSATSGTPFIGEHLLRGKGRVPPGQWVVTNSASSARLEVGRIGVVELAPNSRLHVIGRQSQVHRLALEQGALEAYILAPPRCFVVDTPSATAVDLGCVYSLEVDPSGAGTLTVIVGWVSFESRGRESFVPAGARCFTRPGRGPGTPHFTDAAPAFKNSLAEVDLAGEVAPDSALAVVLVSARREDAFTLWHLLVRLDPVHRAVVEERLRFLVPPPPGVTREGIITGDRAMLDRWWDALGLGLTKDWRRWKGPDPAERRPS